MLINYINTDSLPFCIIWLDWCFYAYKLEFFVFQLISLIQFEYNQQFIFKYDNKLLIHTAIGIGYWVIYCLYNQGWAVG